MISLFGNLKSSVEEWMCPHPDTIPEECQSLLERLGHLTSFSQFNNPYPIQFVENRDIVLGRAENGDEILIKRPPRSRYFMWRASLAKQDQLAHQISHRLGLHVVPPAVAIEGFPEEVRKVSEAAKEHLVTSSDSNPYRGVVIQEKVKGHRILDSYTFCDPLFITCPSVLKPLTKVMLFVSRVFRTLCLSIFLDKKHLTRAILFNIVTGRTDARRENSIISSSGKIMEFDNEYLGREYTTTWLLDAFADYALSTEVIDGFLEKDVAILEEIFVDMNRRYSSESFWCPAERRKNSIAEARKNILSNFERLQTFLIENKDRGLKVSDLLALMPEEESEATR